MNPLVLVVDDEPDVDVLFRQQFRRDLRSDRFTMEFAQSAPMALQRITDAGDRSLILILSDINMPGMSGIELLPKAKALRPPAGAYSDYLGDGFACGAARFQDRGNHRRRQCGDLAASLRHIITTLGQERAGCLICVIHRSAYCQTHGWLRTEKRKPIITSPSRVLHCNGLASATVYGNAPCVAWGARLGTPT